MNHTKPVHVPQDMFPVVNDCLQIGGISITRLAQRVGETPFYAYDRNLITERVQYFRASLPSEIKLHFSVKANPMPALLQYMASLLDGFDVASSGELKQVLDTAMNPDQISFSGPGKTDRDLAQAIASGVVINLESKNECERTAGIGGALGITPKVGVRVNPDFELKSSGMTMGGGARQFGLDVDQVPALLKRIGQLGLDFHGFHIYSGSQNLNAIAIIEAQKNTFELAIKLSEHAPQVVRSLNIGCGFGIPYFCGETSLDLQLIGENLSQCMQSIKPAIPMAEVIMESGRYLVGESGIYVSRVIDRKISRGQVFLICDGGMNHNLAASGNLGQVIRKNYPVAVGNKMCGIERETVSVTGPLCTPLDLIADRIEMACAEPGDLIVVFKSGAYGLTASPTDFLSHPRPIEVLV